MSNASRPVDTGSMGEERDVSAAYCPALDEVVELVPKSDLFNRRRWKDSLGKIGRQLRQENLPENEKQDVDKRSVLQPSVVQYEPKLDEKNALREMAKRIHDLSEDEFEKEKTTIALVEVVIFGRREIWAAASSGGLNDAQEAELRKRGVRIFKGDHHAERNLINNLPRGARVVRWGISWSTNQKSDPCEGCEDPVQKVGGDIERDRTASPG